MIGTHNVINNEYRMHHIIILPPECYKCTACGLCGDFQGGPPPQFETCDGEQITLVGGTYSQDYIEHHHHMCLMNQHLYLMHVIQIIE